MEKIVPLNAVTIPDTAELAFHGELFDVYHWQQERFDGSHARFEMLRRADSVKAVCIVEDKIVVLTDEQPGRDAKLTIAGGRIDAGETLETALAREVREEIGYEFAHAKLVQVTQPQRKIEWFVYTFVVWQVTNRLAPSPDPGERIQVRLLPFDEVKQLVEAGEGDLWALRNLFAGVASIDELIDLPEFTGRRLNRPDGESSSRRRRKPR